MAGKPKISPEQNQAIVDRYKAKESALSIATSYGVSRSAVHLVLFKMGVPRNHKGGSAPTAPEICEQMLKMYVDNKIGATTIARKFGVDKATVYNVITAAGHGTRPRSDRCGDQYQISDARQRKKDRVRLPPSRHRQLPVNHAAFDELTMAAAYWIGYLITDGNVHRSMTRSRRITLVQSRHHRTQVEKFRAFVGAQNVIKDTSKVTFGKLRHFSSVCITSEPIAEALARYGIGPNKTGTVEAVPAVADNSDFWRGVIEGDGSVYEDRIAMNSSSLALVDQFDAFVRRRVAGAKPTRYYNETNGVWSAHVSVLAVAAELAAQLYRNASEQTALPDKWDRARVLMKRGL